MLSAAFFLAQLAAIATMVHAIPFLLERGHSAAFAAFALGLVGISQIPGRVLFGPLAARLRPAYATAAVFALMVAGIAVVVTMPAAWVVILGFVLLGMGNGMATLARATVIADRYGQRAYGTIAGVAGSFAIAAWAIGPVAAAVYAAAFGYAVLLWSLAPWPWRPRRSVAGPNATSITSAEPAASLDLPAVMRSGGAGLLAGAAELRPDGPSRGRRGSTRRSARGALRRPCRSSA